MTDHSLNRNFAGPISFDRVAFERDAQIPEKNDGKKVDEAEWLKSAAASEKEIFQKQTQFFEELERRAKA
jgi:hypothetical protein